MTQSLAQKFDALAELGALNKDVSSEIIENLAPGIELRPYQIRALERFLYYIEDYADRPCPSHLLFHMATGSGKTVLMTALILYLYSKGHQNFLFFVNSTQIIEKTKDNFLNAASSKFLFAPQIRIGDELVDVRAVRNFEEALDGAINIHFTTIQGLHRRMQYPAENAVTFDDFETRRIVLISDEAHHLNAETKSNLGKAEEDEKVSWESTVARIWSANPENILMEFTATVDLSHPAIQNKYQDKIIFDYGLKTFREEGYSKEIELRYVDTDVNDRMLCAVIMSQHRRKLGAAHGVDCKPVLLMKSKTIAESKQNESQFHKLIEEIDGDHLLQLRQDKRHDPTISQAFDYILDERSVGADELSAELKLDFAPSKVENVNELKDLQARQIKLNTLEDHENELRVIFAVDKLNEGWDVLNLFDIVRLYDTRDGRVNKVGRTTMQEAQLIGRGARYFPFKSPGEPDAPRAMRKYDSETDHPLRLLEQLHYHCSHNPRYIQDIKNALRETGMLDETARTVTLKVKDSFKQTNLYQRGYIWLNSRIKNPRDTVQGLDDYLTERQYTYPRFATGRVTEISAFGEEPVLTDQYRREPITETWLITDLGQPVLRFALDTNSFFHFVRLKNYFPKLTSMKEFMTTDKFLGGMSVKVTGLPEDLKSVSPKTKIEIAQFVLHAIETDIKQQSVEFKGTKDFEPYEVNKIVTDKSLKISVQGERGLSWSESNIEGLDMIDLNSKGWHVYNDSYGTDQEKFFIRFIHENEDNLKAVYQDFHLVRNERLFKLYAFGDGRVFEPDFVLFLRRAADQQETIMQIFVEPKGSHLVAKDRWKEDFLKELKSEARMHLVFQNRDYRILGLPFFNGSGQMLDEFKRCFEAEVAASIQ